jgi:drug/metabolite transporter (DMT)-like permease
VQEPAGATEGGPGARADVQAGQGIDRPASPTRRPRTARERFGGAFSLLLTGVADIWTAVRTAHREGGDAFGLVLMVFSAASFSAMAAFSKLLLPDAPTQAVVFTRATIMAATFGLMARARGVSLAGHRPMRLILRGLLGYGAVSCYFYSVQHLPIGDAVLLQYSHPVFVAVLAPLLLGERIGRWHWLLVAIALVGVAFIVGPSGQIREQALVGLLGSVLSGFAYITVRDLSKTEHPLTILFWFPAIMIPGSLIAAIAAGKASIPTTGLEVLGHVAVTVTGLVGQFALTEGLARTGAARATAVTMTGPIFGMIFGWWFFATFPSWPSVAGTALVIGALVTLALNRPAPVAGSSTMKAWCVPNANGSGASSRSEGDDR